jgi:hypothetical protein|tara:strand:+ start:281 stop:430 length:150 start_codon:yes stop_codon:yes gene_type:complete
MIYKSYKEFLVREDRKGNGCLQEFLDEYYGGDLDRFKWSESFLEGDVDK